MLKVLYIIIILIYVAIIGLWCYRFPISYKMTNGTYHDLVVDHDFTEAERDGVEKAYRIRQNISNILFFSSVVLSVISFTFLRNQWFQPVKIVKIVMIVAGIIALILILVNGIHFIPGPPIR
jgi:hypothetical protein